MVYVARRKTVNQLSLFQGPPPPQYSSENPLDKSHICSQDFITLNFIGNIIYQILNQIFLHLGYYSY